MGGIAPPVIGRRVKPPPKNLAINRRKSVTAQSPSNGAPQSPQGAVKGLNRDKKLNDVIAKDSVHRGFGAWLHACAMLAGV